MALVTCRSESHVLLNPRDRWVKIVFRCWDEGPEFSVVKVTKFLRGKTLWSKDVTRDEARLMYAEMLKSGFEKF